MTFFDTFSYQYLTQFLLITPTLQWILETPKTIGLEPKRPSLKAFSSAIALLVAVAIGFAIANHSPSYYTTLGVYSDASVSEITSGYRVLARKWHPDRNPGNEDAAIEFMKIQKAYDCLKDAQCRYIYDTWGINRFDEVRLTDDDLMMQMGIKYVISLMIVFILTFSKKVQSVRTFAFVALAVRAAVEAFLVKAPRSETQFPYLCPFEVVAFMDAVWPSFLNGMVVIGRSLFSDKEELMRNMMMNSYAMNLEVLSYTRAIARSVGDEGKQLHIPSELRDRLDRLEEFVDDISVRGKEIKAKIMSGQKQNKSSKRTWTGFIIDRGSSLLLFYVIANYILK